MSAPPPGLAGPRLVTGAGVLVMVGAGLAAAPYTPNWFDPDDDRPGPGAADALQALWVVEWAGLGVVLLGLVLTGWRLRSSAAPPVARPLPVWVAGAAAALAGAVLCAVLGWFLLIGAFISEPAIPAGLCVFWLAHAAAVTALDRRAGPDQGSALPGWLAGLAVGAVAVAAVAWWAVEVRDPVAALPVVDGAALALGLLVRRAAAAPTGAPRWSAAVTALAVLATAAAVLVVMSAAEPPEVTAADPVVPVTPYRPPPEPAPAAEPAPVEVPVTATVACTPADLDWSATGWDAAMGTRAVTVVATSRASRPCYLDGFAEITIAQGGRPLRLTTRPEAPEARRVALAPGGAASFGLIWAGYGAAADEETPQELRVTLPGGGPGTVALGTRPAPFDLVDGGTVRVGPWQPGPPS